MYRQICCHFWTDPKVHVLDPHTKLLFLYLITNPHSHFSGIYYLPIETIRIETGLRVPRYPIDTLSDPYLAFFDDITSTIWVKNMLKYQGVGAKHVVAISKHLQTLHYSCLIKSFLEEYASFQIPYRYPIGGVSGIFVKEKEKEKEKEQEREQPAERRRSSHTAPADFKLSESDRQWASETKPGINVELETAKFLDYEFRTPHRDWLKTWRNWIRNAKSNGPGIREESIADRTSRIIEAAENEKRKSTEQEIPGQPSGRLRPVQGGA
jgi:hypothetical protein